MVTKSVAKTSKLIAPAKAKAAQKVPTNGSTPHHVEEALHKPEKTSETTKMAQELIEANNTQEILHYAHLLNDSREAPSTKAARVFSEIVTLKPQMAVVGIDQAATAITSSNTRVVSAVAEALPVLAKIAPARIAKHLEQLTDAFSHTSATGKDGLVRTFAALCAASVAYQKRLEPALAQALGEADGKTLQRWTEAVLPALKGEPHARARAVVESRLNTLPKAFAQKIASYLGVKLRPSTVR